jgi:hypothetical protein
MIPSTLAVLLLISFTPALLRGQAQSAAVQIEGAVQAAPEALRSGAAVLGFDESGSRAWVRAGNNNLVCLADDPSDDQFSVACYHRSLEPYMARGRELFAEGVTGAERDRIRWEEAESGTLEMPDAPATLYVLTGSGFDPASEHVSEAYLRFVVYTPWATVESTGLPDRPAEPGAPWLMFPGTPGAHIMISPPPPGG